MSPSYFFLQLLCLHTFRFFVPVILCKIDTFPNRHTHIHPPRLARRVCQTTVIFSRPELVLLYLAMRSHLFGDCRVHIFWGFFFEECVWGRENIIAENLFSSEYSRMLGTSSLTRMRAYSGCRNTRVRKYMGVCMHHHINMKPIYSCTSLHNQSRRTSSFLPSFSKCQQVALESAAKSPRQRHATNSQWHPHMSMMTRC